MTRIPPSEIPPILRSALRGSSPFISSAREVAAPGDYTGLHR
jgi:hypothetical protein